jgi:hypothetical protein
MKFYKVDGEAKKVEVFNERWYPNKDYTKWYRNITTILNIVDKGFQYDEWLKNVGHNAEIIVDRAGKLGSTVHNMVERTLLGNDVSFGENILLGEALATMYWERYLIWCKFWKALKEEYEVEYDPKWVELVALSDKHTYGCTIDLILRRKPKKGKDPKWELIDIDWKTGNSIHEKDHLQVVAGMRAYEEMCGERVSKGLIVHMPLEKPNKNGYRIYEIENSDELYEQMLAVKRVYDWKNKGNDPKFLTYPTVMNLKSIEEMEIIKETR